MGYRVLIVDDSKLARMAMGRALDTLYPDWVRIEAANAAAAAELLADVDLVLLDFNMPGQDGLAFAGELQGRFPGMPVAIISANHQKEVVDGAAAAGATFLAKPLTTPALGAFLDDAVRRLQSAGR